jgi:glycosyltransferase involved in cell wall biosynthesis
VVAVSRAPLPAGRGTVIPWPGPPSRPAARQEGVDVAVLLPHLEVGGAELSMLRVAQGLAGHGLAVDLLTPRARGGLLDGLGPGLRLVTLQGGSTGRATPDLARYLARRHPAVLISGQPHLNIAAVAACALAGGRTRVALIEHAPLSHEIACYGGWRYRALTRLVPPAYRRADAVVAVSGGVREELRRLVPGLEPEVIANPVLPDALALLQAAPAGHPWLDDGGPPVVASVGRLAPEKDFPALVQALSLVVRHRPARLLILGEGPERERILATAASLGVADRVALPGRAANVFAPLSRAKVFALASRFEGFGNVLVEALACRLPVVSTDCPVGPREILAHGRFGRLVPPGDAPGLAAAILAALEAPASPPGLEEHLRPFTLQASVADYLGLVTRLRACGRQGKARASRVGTRS